MSEDSADNEVIAPAGAIDLRSRVRALQFFEALLDEEVDAIARQMEWFGLPGGSVLFQEGDAGDALYLVLSGRLGALTRGGYGRDILLAQIPAGETVGEMALVSGEPRSATVVALRDTEMLRLSQHAFDRLVEDHPRALRFITRLLVRRLYQTSHPKPGIDVPKTVALVPVDAGVPIMEFTRSLADALGQLTLKVLVLDSTAASQSSEWFDAVEKAHHLLLYQSSSKRSEWTRLCLRQADRVMIVARSSPPAAIEEALDWMPTGPRKELVELAILHAHAGRHALGTDQLLRRFPVSFHYHVRDGHPADIARVARLISGRAIGLVLSGGGARGFAHLGVILALRAAGVPIDMVGGTSIGSLIAAGAALEWEEQEFRARLLKALVIGNPLNDYTLPVIALVRGRKVSRRLREHFGGARIEDTWLPLFCTSSSLTSGQVRTHRAGVLWSALRASIAIPGVLPPVIEGNEILIDGGILNNLPVDVMSSMRRGRVIGVDVAREHSLTAVAEDLDELPLWRLLGFKRRGTPNIIELLMRAGTVSSEAQLKVRRSQIDLLIEPHLDTIGMLDWKSYQAAIDAGYRQTMETLEKASLRSPTCGSRLNCSRARGFSS